MTSKFIDDKYVKHLHEVFNVSKLAAERYYDIELDETDNFIFLGISKINKIALSLLHLYPQLDTLPDLEFFKWNPNQISFNRQLPSHASYTSFAKWD